MLLSTDWFLPYWSLLGIQADLPSKECFQQGCRNIVLQFMDDCEEYYLINFSEPRTEQTRANMRALIDACRLEGAAKSIIENLIASNPQRQRFYTVAWLFMTVVKDLSADVLLDSQITDKLRRSEIEFGGQWDTDFTHLCLKSPSQWDTYIRNLTPELPTTLSDLLSVSLLTSRQLIGILEALTHSQRSTLLSRFRSVAKSITGVEVGDAWPTF